MVKLEPIQQKEFEIFLARGIREYAEDHVRNGNWTAEEALERSKKEKGYGKEALAALDEKLISMNVDSVGLHVFGHNIVAQELYKKSGYEITNINMRKVFGKTDSAS